MELLTVVPIFLLLMIIQNEVVSGKKRINKYARYDCACGEINNNIFYKIVGGKTTKPHAYPWHAFVTTVIGNETEQGGGTVINDYYILTAGHVVQGIPLQNFTIGLGIHNLKKYNPKRYQSYKAMKIIIHKDYKLINYYLGEIMVSDIALIKVNRRIIFTDFVKPICLPNKNEKIEGKIATAIGWGRTIWNVTRLAQFLQETQVKVLTRRECQSRLEMFDDTMMCTSGSKHSICKGDSGGSLFYTNQHGMAVQIGISSFTTVECGNGVPGFFAPVAVFLDWIRKHTKGSHYCYKEL